LGVVTIRRGSGLALVFDLGQVRGGQEVLARPVTGQLTGEGQERISQFGGFWPGAGFALSGGQFWQDLRDNRADVGASVAAREADVQQARPRGTCADEAKHDRPQGADGGA
jgi:hypothetical protein